VATVGLWPMIGSATGFRLPDQDAFATARGEAFVATADNPSAIYYNPAGMTQLPGQNFRAGIYGIDLEPEYQSPSGGTYENDDKLHAVPQLFYTYSLEKCPVTLGLGAYAPFGLGIEWPQDTGFRTVGTKASLAYFTVSPAIAWQVGDTLSLGAALTVNYSQVDLRQGMLWPAQDYDQFRFEGSGWDVGYILGIRWQAHQKLSFGGVFRSTTEVTYQGHTSARNTVPLPSPPAPFPVGTFSTRTGAKATFDFPLEFVVGVSYRPTPAWNFEFNAEYTGWNSLGTVMIRQDAAFPPLLPQDIPLVLNWEPSWYYEFGATRYLRNGWHVSAGYIFNENSVPDANYQPLVADLDRHFFSAGVGKKGQRWNFDVAYQFGYGPTRTVSGSAPSPAGQSADGDYSYISHAILVTVGRHF
jgi:long-chain fatty acid transport protein